MFGSLKISMIVSAATTLANQTHDTELHGFCFTRRDSQSEAKQWHGTGIRKREGVAMNSVGSMRPSWDGNINFLDAPDWSA